MELLTLLQIGGVLSIIAWLLTITGANIVGLTGGPILIMIILLLIVIRYLK